MSTNAGTLLDIMSLRLEMQKDGTTNPHAIVKKATQTLVTELSQLEASEKIEIVIHSNNPFYAQYIRTKTGKVLAEINENQNT